MGSAPSTLFANKHSRRTTVVQQICIDQNSGQVRPRRDERGEQSARRRLSSAVGFIGERIRTSTRRRPETTDSKQLSEKHELLLLRQKLADSERVRNELELRLKVLEKEKRDMEADWTVNGRMQTGELMEATMPNAVEQVQFDQKLAEKEAPACNCGWQWQEQLTQRLRERDEIWAKRLSGEVAIRRRLQEAIAEQIGHETVAKILEKMNNNNSMGYSEGAQCAGGKLEENASKIESNESLRPKTCSNSGETNKHSETRKKSDSMAEFAAGRLTSSPPTRLSTSSTLHSARTEQQQPMAVFRPSFQLRRQLGAKIPPVLDLDGICLDEKWRAEGPLAEEFEGEEEPDSTRKDWRIPQGNNIGKKPRFRDFLLIYLRIIPKCIKRIIFLLFSKWGLMSEKHALNHDIFTTQRPLSCPFSPICFARVFSAVQNFNRFVILLRAFRTSSQEPPAAAAAILNGANSSENMALVAHLYVFHQQVKLGCTVGDGP